MMPPGTHTASVDSASSVAPSAIDGVGKTQIAQEYAGQHTADYEALR